MGKVICVVLGILAIIVILSLIGGIIEEFGVFGIFVIALVLALVLALKINIKFRKICCFILGVVCIIIGIVGVPVTLGVSAGVFGHSGIKMIQYALSDSEQ